MIEDIEKKCTGHDSLNHPSVGILFSRHALYMRSLIAMWPRLRYNRESQHLVLAADDMEKETKKKKEKLTG
jgi:hypothetical protein